MSVFVMRVVNWNITASRRWQSRPPTRGWGRGSVTTWQVRLAHSRGLMELRRHWLDAGCWQHSTDLRCPSTWWTRSVL